MVLTNPMAIMLRERAAGIAAMDTPTHPPLRTSADAEARLIAGAVAKGDEAAFQELYDRYHERLFRLVLVLGRGDEALAHDVVQLTLLTAAAKLRPVETEEHLWNWLARVARQHLSKEWRKQGREPAMMDLADVPEQADTSEPDAVLEQGLETALRQLEQEEREIIEWFYFDGMSQKDIALRLNATPKAVSSRLERARAKLRLSITRIISHET